MKLNIEPLIFTAKRVQLSSNNDKGLKMLSETGITTAKGVKMKFLLLVALALYFTACGSTPNHSQIDFNGKRIVFIGDSITAGTVSEQERYVNLYAADKNATFLNLGISGQVLQPDTGCGGAHFPIFDKTTIPEYQESDAALFIALGTNDIGVNNGQMNPDSFKQILLEVVLYATETRNWPINQIILLTPFKTTQAGKNLYVSLNVCGINTAADEARASSYASATRSVSIETGAKFVDIYDGMAVPNFETLISADGIHPNVLGNEFIASFLLGQGF
jgi:lysophospholipase L1-like esterase